MTDVKEQVSDAAYELSLKGPGITVSKDVDQAVALAIVQITLGGSIARSGLGCQERRSDGIHVAAGVGQPIALREFLQEVANGKSIPAKIATVARHMRDHENQGEFARDDIRARFRSAGEPPPANFHRDFQKAVQAGWIAEDHQNRGRFYLTRTGDEAIDQRFESAAPDAGRARRRRRARPNEDSEQQ